MKNKVIEAMTEFAKHYYNEKLRIGGAISRFIFDQSKELKMQCNEISVTIDPKYKSDNFVDIVIYDDSWNELKRVKTLNDL